MFTPYLCRTLTGAGLVALATMASGTAFAATTTGMQVNATIPNSCTVAATTMDFGTLASGGSLSLPQTDATGTLTVNCLNNGSYEIQPSSTTQSGDNFYMAKGATGATITYHIYNDSARTSPYPNAQTSSSQGGTGTGSNQTITIYGRIPAQTVTQAGAYSDTLNFTITY